MTRHDPPETAPDSHPAPGSPPAADASNGLGFELPPPRQLSRTRLLGLGALGLALLGGAAALGALPRLRASRELQAGKREEQSMVTRVQVAVPREVRSDQALTLPASVMPLEQTTVYPRSAGYVRKWHVDLGDHVAEGALLAEIDSPEIDQQLAQARADLAKADAQLVQARANREFSRSTLERYKALAQGVATKQEVEQRQAQSLVDEASVKAAEATVNGQRANVQRLNELRSFSRILAPFAGTINARMIERGALASATTPLFRLSSSDPVRVIVDLPQSVATTVKVDMLAALSVREFGARKFEGKVARSAGALDPQTRTMKTEIRIPNPQGELMPGMYGQLSLSLPSSHRVLEIPSTAVSTDASGVRVAVVTRENTIHLASIVIERDLGSSITVASGLEGDERVVKLFSVGLTEGKPVEVAP